MEILIHLWMAHDFIPLKKGELLERVGIEIFDELTWTSFFQDVKLISRRKNYQLRSTTVCKIHDLMHDIAVSVMGNDCLNIVDRHIQKELLSAGPTRHLFSSYRFIGTLLDDYLKIHSPALQTQLCPTYSLGLAPHLLKYSHL